MNHRKTAFVFLLLGSLCAILAFSTTSWMELSHNGLKIHIGLWRMCSTNCSDLNGIVLRKNLKISLITLEGGEAVIHVL